MKNETLIATRKQSSKTQAQVAKEIGIAKNAYQRYELGKVTQCNIGNKNNKGTK